MILWLLAITIYQNYWQMEVNLAHHGYNPERRKMYPANPRNNLVSTVDLAWEKSLQNQKDYLNHHIKLKKEEELGDINQSYTRAIQAKMEEEARLNKSSFRVMPNYPIDNKPQRENSNSAYRDSLADELVNFRDKIKGQTASLHFQSPNQKYNTQNIRNHIVDGLGKKPIQNSSNVSSSVFGYNINYQTFKRESYMSKLLSDRLQPYLSKSVDKKLPKHSTFTINSPVPVYYQ